LLTVVLQVTVLLISVFSLTRPTSLSGWFLRSDMGLDSSYPSSPTLFFDINLVLCIPPE